MRAKTIDGTPEFYEVCCSIEDANPEKASSLAVHLLDRVVHEVEITNNPEIYTAEGLDIDDMPFLIDAAKYAADRMHTRIEPNYAVPTISVPMQRMAA
jgi:hypothetical protein